MFENIKFTTTTSQRRLSSRNLSTKSNLEDQYDMDNLLHSNFSISGSVKAFQKPPITAFAQEKLYYMQDFVIFHYNFGSYTERQDFHSFLILYTYSGNGKLTYDGKTYSLSKGDGFFINCMDYHKYEVIGNSWETGVLHFNGPLSFYLHEQYMKSGSPLFHESETGKIQQLLEQLLILYAEPQIYRDWKVSNCFDNLLNHLLQLSATGSNGQSDIPENIRYLLNYLEHNYQQDLSLDFLAEFFNISKYYLSREFKKYTGFSLWDYVLSLRLNKAKLLLKSTTLPATKIAHEIGIHDANNFTNLFKKKFDMTPIEFRKSDGMYF